MGVGDWECDVKEEDEKSMWLHGESAWITKAGTRGTLALCKTWLVECNVDDTLDYYLHVRFSAVFFLFFFTDAFSAYLKCGRHWLGVQVSSI
jgi:hypothetical protein